MRFRYFCQGAIPGMTYIGHKAQAIKWEQEDDRSPAPSHRCAQAGIGGP
ncbi:MAG: hypothetical protein NC548_03355 [Lachnospiraceae bacterium]|nr:hypothetical protein [Lachnospiraceae bacterium]